MQRQWVSRVLGVAPFLVLMLIALAIRLPLLDQRPMHGDEANQAVRTGILLDTGTYHYDPTDHHGPVLYFAALPFCRINAHTFTETTEWHYRLVPVVFSCLTLLLMMGLGVNRNTGLLPNRTALYSVILLTIISPAMTYYSRFFIQETMLVTFLTGMLLCAVSYVRTRVTGTGDVWQAAGFGACAGLAMATKETVILSFAAAVVAAVAACGMRRLYRVWKTRDALVALIVSALVAALFFSSFFTYPEGIYEALFKTMQAYLARATTVLEHQHPWYFYLKTLFWFKYGRGPVWSEAGLLVPACVAAIMALWPRQMVTAQVRWVRFILFYTIGLTIIYSAIPYKTPWCALTFLHGYILLAGIGLGWCVEVIHRFSKVGRWLGIGGVALLISTLCWTHGRQTYRACFTLSADPRNPYVYAHTGRDALNLVDQVEKSAQKIAGETTLIAVAVPTPDTWPLPWYLRRYTQVGYWTCVADIPSNVIPSIVICAADQGEAAEQRWGKGKRAAMFGIRPGVLLNLFVPVFVPGEKSE